MVIFEISYQSSFYNIVKCAKIQKITTTGMLEVGRSDDRALSAECQLEKEPIGLCRKRTIPGSARSSRCSQWRRMRPHQASGIVGAIPFPSLLYNAAVTHARVLWRHNLWNSR